jgi:outer membrane protein TolC
VNWEREPSGGEVMGPELEVELPLFDANQAQIAKAEYLVRQEQKKALALKSMVFEQVGNRLAEIAFLRDKLRITRESILPARQKASNFAGRWASLMQLSQVERLQAESELLHTELELINTRLALALALAGLELELGGALPK